MGSSGEKKKKNEKDSVKISDLDLTQEIPNIIQQNLQGVRKEIQILQSTTKDLHLMIRGIDGELQELKKLAKRINHRIDSVGVKKAPKPHIKEISSGLDYLTQIPQHLRDTFRTFLKRDTGATAKEVSHETGKSRSLESDYLNQLVDKGYLMKRRQGKRVLFYKIGELEEEEEEEEEEQKEVSIPAACKKSLSYIAEKQMVVNDANNLDDKKAIRVINIDDK